GDAVADDLDLLDPRAVDLERPLDAHARGDAADRDRAGDPTAAEPHDGALEHLDALAAALDDLGRHLDGVTRREFGEVGSQLVLDDLVEHGHKWFLPEIGQPKLRVGLVGTRGVRRRRSIARPRTNAGRSVLGREVRPTVARPGHRLLTPPSIDRTVVAGCEHR